MEKRFSVTVEVKRYQASAAADFSEGLGSPLHTLAIMGLSATTPAIHVPTGLIRDAVLALRCDTSALAHGLADGYQAILTAQVG